MVTFFDLRKAFDLVPHNKLLDKMEKYGIVGKELNMFDMYLKNRKQYLQLNNKISHIKEIKRGVIRGSVLGPILFLIYFNDFSELADDTTIVSRNVDLNSFMVTADNNLEEVKQWLGKNEMILNIEKTKRLVFTLCSQNHQQETMKFLGLTLDTKLSWKSYINNIRKELFSATYLLRKLKDQVTPEVIRLAYHGLLQSTIAYGLIFWGFSRVAEVIFRQQKKAVRITKGTMSTADLCFKSTK